MVESRQRTGHNPPSEVPAVKKEEASDGREEGSGKGAVGLHTYNGGRDDREDGNGDDKGEPHGEKHPPDLLDDSPV